MHLLDSVNIGTLNVAGLNVDENWSEQLTESSHSKILIINNWNTDPTFNVCHTIICYYFPNIAYISIYNCLLFFNLVLETTSGREQYQNSVVFLRTTQYFHN